MSLQISMTSNLGKYRSRVNVHECAVCGARSIGVNFGVPSCAPCKAFFRRNARKTDRLELACRSLHSNSYNNEDLDSIERKLNICFDLRHCTSCRLRKCLYVGMKIELIRTDEENQHYRQLIETNRRRKRDILILQETQQDIQIVPRSFPPNNTLLQEKDWRLLSNIINAYDIYCVKHYSTTRKHIFNSKMKYSDEKSYHLQHHTAMRVNSIDSIVSFLSSIPMIRLLSRSNQTYLCNHNILALVVPNICELDQACFSEPSELALDTIAAESTYGKSIFNQWNKLKQKVQTIIINDPAVTRVWFLILFFSTPLFYSYDSTLPTISSDDTIYLNKIQNSFVNLLWNYLVQRQGYFDAIRIFDNLVRVYLHMQKFLRIILKQLRTRNDLTEMNRMIQRALVFNKS